MRVYLVRHAKAGNRKAWTGEDELRPLSGPGWAQAAGLAGWLGEQSVPCLVSSPYLRCRQTLEPLAALLDLKVEDSDALAEGAPLEPTLDLLDAVPSGAVLCTHGDVLLAMTTALGRRGLELRGPPDWRKGVTWVLEQHRGAWRSAHVVLPGR